MKSNLGLKVENSLNFESFNPFSGGSLYFKVFTSIRAAATESLFLGFLNRSYFIFTKIIFRKFFYFSKLLSFILIMILSMH